MMSEESQGQDSKQDAVEQPGHVSDHNFGQEEIPSETRKEHTAIIEHDLGQYEGPKNDRELEIAVEETRRQFAHTDEAFELSSETKKMLDEKMNGEIAQTHERMIKYQELLREGQVASTPLV